MQAHLSPARVDSILTTVKVKKGVFSFRNSKAVYGGNSEDYFFGSTAHETFPILSQKQRFSFSESTFQSHKNIAGYVLFHYGRR